MRENRTNSDCRVRYDWTDANVRCLYKLPLPKLVFLAQATHRAFHDVLEVQACSLLSVKTGGCPEDCSYCPQSAHYGSAKGRHGLLDLEEVLAEATRAKVAGATRFCMGGAWRNAPGGSEFNQLLEMVRGVRALGLEACCTLGMLNSAQADALAAAGLTAYNHNLDTSREFYSTIVSTRTYDDRVQTIGYVRGAGIGVCCGGIIGMGESREDRCALLRELATFNPHPESVPINLLVPVAGTPLGQVEALDPFELVRTVATARILMPASMVRLSAGRLELSDEAQALCFMAGANSIFFGERLLTTGNPCPLEDLDLLERLGLRLSRVKEDAGRTPFAEVESLRGMMPNATSKGFQS